MRSRDTYHIDTIANIWKYHISWWCAIPLISFFHRWDALVMWLLRFRLPFLFVYLPVSNSDVFTIDLHWTAVGDFPNLSFWKQNKQKMFVVLCVTLAFQTNISKVFWTSEITYESSVAHFICSCINVFIFWKRKTAKCIMHTSILLSIYFGLCSVNLAKSK